jgi:PTH2 family peptidyl-tRNA hydrolase
MNEELPKQWIVLRKDLKMRKGKMVAQGSHGVLKVFLEQMVRGPEEGKFTFYASGAVLAWLEGKFTKVCVGVQSEEELLEVYEKAKAASIMCTLITDAGLTEFDGVPTNTCVVIGPAYPSQVKDIVGDLKLL